MQSGTRNGAIKMKIKRGQKVDILVHGAGVVSEEKSHTVARVTKTQFFLEGLDSVAFDLKSGKTGMLTFGFWYETKLASEPVVVSKSQSKRLAIQKAKPKAKAAGLSN